ncbi:MAG TPA: TonB-dependent receptor, partial [Vicinamibacterales bacterium]|nr:TonB-dependent receptor [Vicinamibacterales bacterium]
MGRVKQSVWVFCVLTLLLPAIAKAQATITGTVKDASGAVLPGVDVEAAGTTLLTPRTVQSDTNGIYRIVELPPGTYTLTFSLSGFTRVVRDGIQLQGTMVATIPVDMKVGAVAETITVTGETPVVDVQTVKQETVLKGETIANIPGTHAYGAILNAIPGLTVDNNGLANAPTMTFFTARGGNTNEGRMTINGMTVAAAFNGGGVSSLAYDSNNVEEVAVTVAGGMGESEIGGPAMNLVPKSGGNRFAGTMFWNYAGSWSSGNNIDDYLRSLQTPLSAPPTIFHSYDINPSYGGPIKREKIWFWAAYRKFDTSVAVPGVFANAFALDPTHYDYKQDPTVSSRNIQGRNIYTGRITAQVTPKNRVMFSHEYQLRCEGSTLTVQGDGCRTRGSDWVALGSTFPASSPEANTGYFKLPYYVTQATWNAPVTSKMLFEAGFTRFAYWTNNGPGQVPPDGTMNLIPVTETQAIDSHPGNFTYRGVGSYFYNWANPDNWHASVSYVAGAHSFKAGYQGSYAISNTEIITNTPLLTYGFNNRAPATFTFRLPNWRTADRTETASLFIQDSWTHDRLTLSGALRYDRSWSFSPADGNGTTDISQFNAAAIAFPLTPGVSAYNDLTPRVGVAYDVFGNGKTAVKFNFGHYLAPATNDSRYTLNNPAQTNKIVTSVTRTWQDNGPNPFAIDCNILNFAAQSGAGSDTCGAVVGNSVNFGKTGNNVALVNPAILQGWGVRPNDYQWGLAVQHQVLPRVSAEVAYNRRWFHWREAGGQGTVTDNLNVTPADYESWTINAPVDPRLPGGGGYPITMYNLTAAGNAKGTQNYITVATDYGQQRTDYWNGIDTSVNARMSNSLTMTLGTSTGRSIIDSCSYQGAYDSPDLRNCHDEAPFQTTLRGSAAYTIPKVDVLVAGTVRSLPGLALGTSVVPVAGLLLNGAIWNVPNSVVQGLLGHLPPGAIATGTTQVPLLDTAHRLYGPRINQVDMRFAKIVRFKTMRANIGIDLINLLNTNAATAYTSTYAYSTGTAATANGGSWYQPTTILQPRY